MAGNELSAIEKERYQRHLNIPQIGESGQLKLKAASVLIVGAGGLGSASSFYLTAAGVGTIGLVDSDKVELSNLQRQILHQTKGVGLPKVDSAKDRLEALNPDVNIIAFQERVSEGMDLRIFDDFPIIIDATDNFETRYFLNQVCVERDKVFIYGAIYQFYGQMSVFDDKKGPCFRCVFRDEPTEDFVKANRGLGVVGALPGVIGNLQALEAMKQILNIGKPSIGRLILFDALDMSFQEIATRKDPNCPVCGGLHV